MTCKDNQKLECVRELADIGGELKVVNTRLEAYNASLEQHMSRTAILESEVKSIRSWQNMIMGAFVLAQILVPFLLKYLKV